MRMRLVVPVALIVVFAIPAQDAAPSITDHTYEVTAETTSVRRPTGPLAPSSGALFGSYLRPSSGWDREAVKQSIRRRERALGRVQDVSHWLYHWDKNGSWPSWRERWHVRKGRIPMASWGGTNTKAINEGRRDPAIRRQADRVRMFRHRMFIRWFWEMNADPSARTAGSPRRFKRAWRRIHDIFDRRGADNAVWVWCPTAWGFHTGEAQRYYPGDRYVDWVCADGFNWYPGRRDSEWRSFEWIYKPFYRWAMKGSKPLMAGTYGVQEDPRRPRRKARWFTAARSTLKTEMRGFSAVLYFDSKQLYDWRVTTSRRSYRAYIRMARDDWFNTGPARRL